MTIFADFHTMMNVLLLAVVFIAILTEIKTAGMGVGAFFPLAGYELPSNTHPLYRI